MFTWSNGHTWERLDRGLINQVGGSLWPNLIEHHIDIGASDHLPLFFMLNGGNLKGVSLHSRRFLFEPIWAQEISCEEVIQAEWDLSIKVGDVLGCLQNIGKRLQRWNKEKVGNIPKKVVLLHEELQRLPFDDIRAEVQERRRTVKQELTKYTAYEEELWVHRSRVTWIKAGDSNTKFFHNYAKSRGWRNKVTGIFDVGGQWHEDISGIQNAFVTFFEQLFSTEGCTNVDLIFDVVIPKIIEAFLTL